jgi:hypothetical protein
MGVLELVYSALTESIDGEDSNGDEHGCGSSRTQWWVLRAGSFWKVRCWKAMGVLGDDCIANVW